MKYGTDSVFLIFRGMKFSRFIHIMGDNKSDSGFDSDGFAKAPAAVKPAPFDTTGFSIEFNDTF